MARVELEHVRKVYDNGYEAVHDATLTVEDGEFVVLVGPSGCGKSTTLRMIAGLESISSGTLRIGDRVVNDVPPKDRDIAMVFQNYALYPHMTVFDNMAFGLKLRKFPKEEIRERVERTAEILGLQSVLDRKPKALSGGQRQRVALGRAIVRKPAVFLFDEPLSNLDAKLRVQTRTEISKLHSDLGATMIYVTHDQVEAMTMGDRIVVLHDGFVQQVAPPLELYDRPANTFVAGFIGSPAMNFIEGRVENGAFVSDSGVVGIDGVDAASGPITLGIRPEDLYTAQASPADKRLSEAVMGAMEVVEPMGNEIFAYVRTSPDTRLVARLEPQQLAEPGGSVELRLDLKKIHLFDRETGVSLGKWPRPRPDGHPGAARSFMPDIIHQTAMLRILTTAASILVVTLALAACEVDTGSETDDDGSTNRTIEFKVDEGALDNARDNLDAAGERLGEAGERLGEAAQSAGETVEGAVEDAGQAIDENVDVGENARDDDG